MKRLSLLSAVALLLIGLLALTACAAPAGDASTTSDAVEESAAGADGDAVELRFIWYDDGEEGAVMRDLLDRFEADNPDTKL